MAKGLDYNEDMKVFIVDAEGEETEVTTSFAIAVTENYASTDNDAEYAGGTKITVTEMKAVSGEVWGKIATGALLLLFICIQRAVVTYSDRKKA